MFNQVFYHDTIRKYVILFGTLFNDIYINKNDGTNPTQTIKIPVSYGPKQKFISRLVQDPSLTKPVAIQLPRIGFELTDITYASERKLPTINRLAVQDPDNSSGFLYQYMPVPYDFFFSLHIMVKSTEDGTRILEQILPFFTPDWTATLNLDPSMKHKYDVPIILTSVSSEDTYEGNFIERRALIWNLTFTMKGFIFGPTRKASPIKTSIINLYSVGAGKTVGESIGNTQPYETITTFPVVPGLSLEDINADDDYTFGQTIEQYYEQ
ncbi:MAG: hypothetical protein EBZ49_00845 [Proteobacteria bacterium]|nr:hypothetical protein [Pseudomonadota bacterium]